MAGERWNSNLHAFDALLKRVPASAQRGLDVGCGEGETTRRLRHRVPAVSGIDVDLPSIARARSVADDVEYLVADLLEPPFPPESFDVVTAVAVVHHVSHRSALRRLSDLVRPGGLLLIVGLARPRSVVDLAHDGFDAVALRRHSLRHGVWESPSPKVWPPPLTYRQARDASIEVLPGARFERLPYRRYGLTWSPP